MEDPLCFARVKNLSSLYYKQAELSYLSFLKFEKELPASPKEPSDEGYFVERDAHSLAEIQTIVFSAMCIEASVYDYAAVHLGDDFVLQHLDKLDIISKWIISLRLISGYALPKGGALYGSLKRLIRARNLLVHIKSEEFDITSPIEQYERLQREGEQIKRDVHESFKCLVLMSLTLQRVAPAASYHLPWRFLDSSHGPDPLPEELRAVVNNCRQILSASVEG